MRRALIAVAAVALLSACAVPADDPTAVQPPESSAKKAGQPAKKPVPIKLVAVRAKAKASVLSSGGALSCVRVTVTNQTKKQLDVNPLYFSITDTTGEKHDTSDALADYEGQIGSGELAPKEKMTGLVCGKGRWTPKVVAMTNPLFDEAARAEVG